MGLHSNNNERPESSAIQTRDVPRGILVVRLVIASVIFAVSAVIGMPAVVKTILLIIGSLVAGYDLILDAVNSVETGDYFNISIILIFVSVIGFVIGYGIEVAAMLILYKVGLILNDYVKERTLMSAEELLRYRDSEEISRTVETANKPGTGELEAGEKINSAASFVLKILIGFGVLFAVFAPLLTHLTVRESIHRALSIILVATPASVVLSIPLVGLVGIFSASRFGVLFNKAKSIEKLADVKTLIVDKAGVLAEECPKLLSVKSDVLDTNTFLTFAAHAVYYSEQPIAKVLSNATDGEYKLEVVSNFSEIPGWGVEVDIGGAHVILATKDLFISRGEAIPFENEPTDCQVFYMMIANRYIGKITVSNSTLDSAENLVADFKANGIEQCILISEDGREDTAAFASKFGFDDAYGELDIEKKLALIENVCSKTTGANMYLYSSGIESHSKADIDVRVSKAGKYADALVNPNSISTMPSAFSVAERIKTVATENAIFVFAVKALLVFLSINGWCNLWFAMFIDSAAVIFTLLNSIRVSSESLLKGMINRRQEEDEFAEE
ncbi:MAG: HAD family hydrolase [Oscillospiraceae bacterium]|nr:HAD family hydrolase [Oscillospiraceae bacterium]